MMNRRGFAAGLAVPLGLGALTRPTAAQQLEGRLVRWAELEVDPAHRAEFLDAAMDNSRESLQEPGVVTFHSAAEKGNPDRIRVLEIYRNASAYSRHLQSAHFQRFARVAQNVLRVRRVHDATPLALGAKPLPWSAAAASQTRVAELEIDPSQLALYTQSVAEEIEDSIRLEPGVLAIYSLSLKDAPNRLRFFEVYADEAAYRQHIASAHFQKYAEVTRSMITSRQLFEMEPLSAEMHLQLRKAL